MRKSKWSRAVVGICVGMLVCFMKLTAQTNTFPSSGNVGIGTTNPVNYLEIDGGDVNKVGMALKNASGSLTILNFQASGSSGFGINGWANAGLIEAEAPNGLVIGSVNALGDGVGGPITFQINRSPVAIISTSGQVGIGTTNPGATLEVNGNVKLTSGSGASLKFPDGTVQSTAYIGTVCPTGGDYAESVDVTGNRTSYEPGDVMVIGLESDSDVAKSSEPYSTQVAGIYSTKPGVVGRRQTTDSRTSTTEIPMAMVGIVPTKVSAENGSISRGDLLVTSSMPGYAMKGTDLMKMLGAVVGKAMGSLNSGTGMIEVLVTLQ